VQVVISTSSLSEFPISGLWFGQSCPSWKVGSTLGTSLEAGLRDDDDVLQHLLTSHRDKASGRNQYARRRHARRRSICPAAALQHAQMLVQLLVS
jgi:hypothetical protein